MIGTKMQKKHPENLVGNYRRASRKTYNLNKRCQDQLQIMASMREIYPALIIEMAIDGYFHGEFRRISEAAGEWREALDKFRNARQLQVTKVTDDY